MLLITCLLLAFTGCSPSVPLPKGYTFMKSMSDDDLTNTIAEFETKAILSDTMIEAQQYYGRILMYQNELIIRQNERIEKALTNK